MIYLFVASFLLVIYGTLFPFSFQPDAHTGGVLATLINSLAVRPGRGDLVSNVVLFLPFGFFGMQALPARIPKFVRYALVFGFGTVTSLGIEITQYYTPSRTTSLYDLGWNSISALIGAAGGRFNWQRLISGGAEGVRPRSIFPLVAVAAWAGYRLFPYVPTIDLQHVKDAIKPLLAMTSVPMADVVRHFGMVLGLARLLQGIMPSGRATLALIVMSLGVIAAKPFIVTKVIAPAEVIGTIAALALWVAILGRLNSRTLIVAVIFTAALAFQGLSPFELRADQGSFSFVPFGGFERGSMAVNLQAFLEKVFLYGTLIWLVAQAGGSTEFSLVFSMIFATAIEVAQMFIVERTSEITDPLLALVIGVVLLALERHYRISPKDSVDP